MKIKYLSFSLILCFLTSFLSAQYDFKDEIRLNCSEIKNQQRTGTCWSFATASFLESELMKEGKNHNLSEMYIVRKVYEDKARNYVFRQGKANFSQGSLSHDLINTVARDGIVPESAFDGRLFEDQSYNHSEMEAVLKGMLDGVLKSKHPSLVWKDAFNAVIDVYMGSAPDKFSVDNTSYSPESYAEMLGIEVNNYISFTSFTHHPFYRSFILEIPDNYSNGSFYNIPIEELKAVVDDALNAGYTVAWDGDVSEKGFSHKNGIAILPTNPDREYLFTEPGPEKEVTQASRQTNFENFYTTDDHLMHLIGSATDKAGNRYYIIKNSWGDKNLEHGYLYMSEAYFLSKTVAVMLNKKAVNGDLKGKILN